MKILSIGEVLWDLFPDGERFGGAPANFACHAAIHGAQVALLSAVGNDDRGRRGLEILRDFKIQTDFVQVVDNAPTGTVGIELDKAGKPTFTIHENSAWDTVSQRPEIDSLVQWADAVYFGTLGQRSRTSRNVFRHCLQRARERGIPRLLDINLRPPFYDLTIIRQSIDLADLLKLSDDELPTVLSACGIDHHQPPEEGLRRLLAVTDLQRIIMTCGARGAMLVTRQTTIVQPAIATKVVDTVGAGDSFAARFLVGLLQGEPNDQLLLAASSAAASTCAHAGAVPARLSSDSR